MYSSIDDFNDLTLSLMINKTYYTEYLEKTNPIKFKELETYKKKINKYSSKILNMTKELFENPDKVFNSETNDIFIEYTKVFIRYLEMKEVEDSNENSDVASSSSESTYKGDEDDMLFGAPQFPEKKSEHKVQWSSNRVKKL